MYPSFINNAQPKCVFGFTMLALVTGFSVTAHAATPDAGTTLRDLTPTTQLPATSPALNIQGPVLSQVPSGGAVITVRQSIRFTGNTLYTGAVLSAILADAVDETYDLAGLQGLTNRISAYYHSQGFSFARALLPVQPMTNGILIIQIIEGRYGSIVATGDHKSAIKVQAFLSQLQPGEVIHNARLERMALILSDQPGFKVTLSLSPGEGVGTGDLEVNVERDKRYSGDLGFNNFGNRYTGRSRVHFDLNIDSPLLFGDQLKLNTLYSDEDMWVGSLNYSLPLGGSGLRANTGYSHTDYELGKEFASSQSHGTTNVSSAGLSYPIIRSQQTNLSVAGTYQHKELNDSDDITPISNTKLSDSLPISLNFDRRDQFRGGGMTYGEVSWTQGNLTVASGNLVTDSSTARTAGGFDKFNLDLARLQTLPLGYTLFSRVSAQWASKNLDSSEKFGLGGVNGVRAYPIGEAYGDEGALVQLEVRYAINNFIPYVFYDAGTLTINHTPYDASNNERNLAGAGLGLLLELPDWHVGARAALRSKGEFSDANQSDTPMLWVSVKYQFKG
jgi:hemolysin activation/secretion protein